MTDILIKNGLVVTIDAQRRIIRDGAVAIEGNTIRAVGKTAEVEASCGKAGRVIDATNRVVCPGFVDAHLHVSNEGPKGYIPKDIAAYPWVMDWVVPINSIMTEEDEYVLSKVVLTEALRTGTTTFFEAGTTKYPAAVAKAVEEIGIRGVVGKFTWDVPREPAVMRQTTKEALRSVEEVVKTYHGKLGGRLSAWVSILGSETQSDELLKGAKALADEMGVGVNMHQSTTEGEVEEFVRNKGKRPIEHFEDLGVLGPNLRLIHMVDVSNREIELLAKYDVKIVNCVTTGLNLGYGVTAIGRFPEMLAKGVCVALGCDGPNCSNTMDMGRAIFLAAGLYKDCRRDTSLVSPEKAWEMGTLDAARSMLMEDQIGSLEVGKKADVILFDRTRPEWYPMLNVVSNMVFGADGKSVETVIVDGKVVVENGKLLAYDEGALFEEMEAIDWEKKIGGALGLRPASTWPVV
ncbi:MAG: amidohydrolase [Candidatus Tectomicrobia bacterium]|nr:amidohydrolase [Candidatus Tectomicrobia bacterium]